MSIRLVIYLRLVADMLRLMLSFPIILAAMLLAGAAGALKLLADKVGNYSQ